MTGVRCRMEPSGKEPLYVWAHRMVREGHSAFGPCGSCTVAAKFLGMVPTPEWAKVAWCGVEGCALVPSPLSGICEFHESAAGAKKEVP